MRRLKAKACVSGGPTSLKITPVAEQDEETTKRREGEDGREEMVVAVQIYRGSIATAIRKHAPF